jgi:AmmeMemoRadiSam system protein A
MLNVYLIVGCKMVLSDEDKVLLLRLAKEAISSEINSLEINSDILKAVKEFDFKHSIFVTLTKDNKLRGCMGHIIPIAPVWQAVIECAKSAAFHDPRFSPVKHGELPFIKVEISILTPMEKIVVDNPGDYPKKIKIGNHGLFIEAKTGETGLLLPQVFPEWNADSVKALNMTCEKAGLPSNAWKNKEMNIFTFEAEIFGENN